MFLCFLYLFLDWFIERPSEKHCSEMSFGRLWLFAASELNAAGTSGGLCCSEPHGAMPETLIFWSFWTSLSNPAFCKLHHLKENCTSQAVLNPHLGPQLCDCAVQGVCKGCPQPLHSQTLDASSHAPLSVKAVFLHAIRPAGNSQKISVLLLLNLF